MITTVLLKQIYKERFMLNLLRSRRSIRSFKPVAIDSQITSIFKEALLRAPSSCGFNPWEFIFVTDKPLLFALKKTKEHGSEFVDESALAVVICADEKKSDVWIEDCSIASIILQFTAQSLGLGSCWIQVRNRKHSKDLSSEVYIQKLLSIPEHYRVLSMIVIGFTDETPKPVSIEELQFAKIHKDKFKTES
jgi:nitroreductase